MTKVVTLYILIGNAFSGGLERVSDYPDMAACKAAVAGNQMSTKVDGGTFSKSTQGDWKTGKGDFICIEGYYHDGL